MNLCNAQAASRWGGDSGAGGTLGGAANAGPAHYLPPEIADEVMNHMADSIVELTGKLEEAEARVAVLEEEQKILQKQFAGVIEGRAGDILGRSDLSPRTALETVAFLRKFNLWRRGSYDQQPPRGHEVGEAIDSACDHIERMEREIDGLRDALCADKCADKASADGGWGNI